MIRVTCPNCQSRLDAKDHLAGKTRKCPKCGKPLLIQPDGDGKTVRDGEEGADAPSKKTQASPTIESERQVAPQTKPDRLKPSNRYLICDKERLIACWQSNGQGWNLKSSSGLLSAKRNRELLPNQGKFVLVELGLTNTDEGLRLSGIMAYHLAASWALPKLARGEADILSSITGPGTLNRQQKATIRQIIISEMMHPMWKDAAEILDFLGNEDQHSPGVGTTE